MQDKLDKFYFNQEEPNQSCLLALRDIIIKMNVLVNETVKYGMPCFCYGKKMLCYLWTDKKTNEPYILFVDGNKMDHPKLESGNRARMKIFRVDPNQDLEIETIHELLHSAISLHK